MKRGAGFVLLLVGSFATLTACQSSLGDPADEVTASAAPRVTPSASGTPANPVSPLDDQGQPTTAPRGKVTVVSAAGRYHTGQAITIVVVNGLSQPIFSDDSKSDCSIVILQRRDDTTWTDIVGCALGRPPATFAIGPSHARTVIINPKSPNFDISTVTLGSGTYRAAYRYRLDQASGADDSQIAQSELFTIE